MSSHLPDIISDSDASDDDMPDLISDSDASDDDMPDLISDSDGSDDDMSSLLRGCGNAASDQDQRAVVGMQQKPTRIVEFVRVEFQNRGLPHVHAHYFIL